MYYFLVVFSKFVSLFPVKFMYGISIAITRTIFFFWPEKRNNIMKNYSIILEKKNGKIPLKKELIKLIWKNIDNYARFNVEFLLIEKIVKSGNVNMPYEGTEFTDKALKYGKGCIMGTLHFGNWDIAGASIGSHIQPVWAVADDLGGGYSRFIQSTREKYGIKIVLPNKNLKDVYTSLNKNAVLNVLVDRPLSPKDKKAVPVDFFGKKAYVASAAARFILKTGAKATIGYAIRENGKFRAVCSSVINYELTGENDKDIRIITQAFLKEAEKIIMQHPEQWYMFREFWQKDN